MGENELCGGERRLERIKEDDENYVLVMSRRVIVQKGNIGQKHLEKRMN